MSGYGMVIDFSKIKGYLNRYDHVYLNEMPELEGINTTAENLAKHWHDGIKEILEQEGYLQKDVMVKITVAETPNNTATYAG